MAHQLTAAGIKLCTALMNNDPTFVPEAEKCDLMFFKIGPGFDRWGRSPVHQLSCPDSDSKNGFCQPKNYRCIVIETYDIFDGSHGSQYLCTREAVLRWTDDGLWFWQFQDGGK